MLLRHAVLAHLDHGVHLAAQVPDRIDAALVLDGAGHLAARPPHDRGRRAGALDHAAPDAHVGPDVDARATIVRTVSSLSATVILAASLAGPWCAGIFGQRVLDHRGTGCAIMPTPMVALEALARSIIDFCLSFIFVSAGAL